MRPREQPVTPAARSRTGPALQFDDLAGVRRGFVYDLTLDEDTVVPELGLVLRAETAQDECGSDVRLQVMARTTGQATGRVLHFRSCHPLETIPRESRRAADTERAASFDDDVTGFWYAVTVNQDPAGRLYAIVRRCAAECE